MKVREELKLKLKAMNAYLAEVNVIASEIEDADLKQEFINMVKAKVRDQLNVAAKKIQDEVLVELSELVEVEKAKLKKESETNLELPLE